MYLPMCPVEVRVLTAQEACLAMRSTLVKPKNLLVLASRGRCRELSLTPFFTALQGDGHALQLYTDIPVNPTVEDVAALLDRLRKQPFEPDAIIAIGGGSCIDLGKAAAALYHKLPDPTADAVREAIMNKSYATQDDCLDMLAMPTTAGTGSEVTRWATVWDMQNKRKLSVDHAGGYLKVAVLVPQWTLGMSPSLTLATGLDALSHAMEAFWAASRNPVSQELALLAVGKISRALPIALKETQNKQAREELCLGSLFAGLAFAQTRTTACHSISYPLTMLKGLPHGLAVAITLSSVMRRNAKAVPEMERLYSVFDEIEGFDAWLEDVTRGIQPLRLSAFGMTEQELPAIVEQTFTAGRMDNNPVVFTKAEVLEILMENL